jgi:hypothetical protein
LVALIACQGTVGPKGDKGDTGGAGMDGDPGDTGMDGPIGPGALAGKEVTMPAAIITKAGAEDEPVVHTIEVSEYFIGGDPEGREYGLDGGPSPTILGVTHELMGSTLMLSVDEDWVAPNSDVADTMFTVWAMDEDDQRAESMVYVRSNAMPTRSSAGDAGVAFIVGTQDAAVDNDDMAYDGTGYECTMLNLCTVDLSLLFEDFNTGEMLTYKLDDIGEDDMGKVTAMIDGSDLHITGMKSSAEFMLMVSASDQGATAEEKAEIRVTVDAAPMVGPVSDLSLSVGDSKHVATPYDSEDATLVPTFTSSNSHVAVATAGTGDDADKIIVTANNPGSTTITITVTEPSGDPQQTATDEFTVRVSN